MTTEELAALRMSLILSGARVEDVEILNWAMRKCPEKIMPIGPDEICKLRVTDPGGIPPFALVVEGRKDLPDLYEVVHVEREYLCPGVYTGPCCFWSLTLNEYGYWLDWDWITLEWCHRWLGE